MAIIKSSINHDWIRVGIKFEDGSKTEIRWSRNNEGVKTEPENLKAASTLAMMIHVEMRKKWNEGEKTTPDGRPNANIGEFVKILEADGVAAKNVDELIEIMKSSFGVTGEMEIPADAPSETTITRSVHRGSPNFEIAFPSGEKMSLRLNKSSLSFGMTPDNAALSGEVSKKIFNAMGLGIDREDLADIIEQTAAESDSVTDWIPNLSDALRPGGMRP